MYEMLTTIVIFLWRDSPNSNARSIGGYYKWFWVVWIHKNGSCSQDFLQWIARCLAVRIPFATNTFRCFRRQWLGDLGKSINETAVVRCQTKNKRKPFLFLGSSSSWEVYLLAWVPDGDGRDFQLAYASIHRLRGQISLVSELARL